jgi:hypothetical protein
VIVEVPTSVTWSLEIGVVVPIPTYPAELIRNFSESVPIDAVDNANPTFDPPVSVSITDEIFDATPGKLSFTSDE